MRRAAEPSNPFPGLRPFRDDEEHLFFGRESQVDTMIDRLAGTHFLAVVGTSGSGKSSLVNCGLRPSLHRGLMAKAGTSWRIAQFRPGTNPVRALAVALSREGVLFSGFKSEGLTLEDMVEASLRMSSLGLADVCEQARLDEGVNLLVVADQFEELFRYRTLGAPGAGEPWDRNQEGTAFVNLLLEAKSQARFPIYIVLTMRSDFLGDCAEFPGLPEAINEGQYLVPRLTREERRAAIAGPVGVGGGEISSVLLTRLVNDVGDNPDQLSILQHALNRTWARWQFDGLSQGQLELPHYEAIGTMAHALDQHAERAYAELAGERQRKVCEKIFKALTDKGTDPRGIRRPTSFAQLCTLAGAGPAEVAQVIEIFRKPSRSFLMPPLPEALEADKVIDISHESLMRVWERLKGWANEEAQSAQLYRRLSETAALRAAGKAGLWRDPDLQVALDWRDKEKPTEAWAGLYGGGFERAMAFLAESEAQREREVREKEEFQRRELQQAQTLAEERQRRVEEQVEAARRLRRWLAALAVASLLLVFAGIYAWRQRTTAVEAKGRAEEASVRARNAAQLADARAREANRARAFAEQQKDEAEKAKVAAEKADNEMRIEALRVRDVNLNIQSSVASMADDLLQHSSPQQAAYWRRLKGTALIEQGNFDDAQALLSNVLELVPDDFDARTSRGYLSVLRNDPPAGVKDFEYIRDHIDRASCLNLLNLTVTYGLLGNFTAANGALKEAIANVRYGQFNGGRDDFIPSDITSATGRTTVTADKEAFEVALYYMKANLESYVGDTRAFQAALNRADERAGTLSPVTKRDAYFAAMVWAWLHLRFRCPDSGGACKDYGALVSQAQLWERAGYREWAGCYYQRFQDQDKRWKDRRYVSLAKWAEQSKAQLGLAPSFSCRSLEEREKDVPALEIEAREARARKNFTQAKALLEQALAKAREPEKARLTSTKADVLLEMGSAEKQKSDLEAGKASSAAARLKELNDEKKAEEDRLRNLAREDSPDWANTRKKIDEKYAARIAKAQNEQDSAAAAAIQHKMAAHAAFLSLKKDCDQILQKDKKAAAAYYYRALAQDWLDSSSAPSIEKVMADLGQALKLDPTYMDALATLDELMPAAGSKEERAYLERYHDALERYYRVSPFNPQSFFHEARLANMQKRYPEALRSIETAIAMQPGNLALYEVRAEAERGLGVNEAQVKRNLADGYRQAGDSLKRHGETASADGAYRRSWETLAQLAKGRDNEEIRCDPSLSTCNVTKTVVGSGEWVYSGIVSVAGEGGAVREARIDKGSTDGIVAGEQGNIWSLYSKDAQGHERHIMKLGTAEVLSVEADSALVRLKMDSPTGDGLARQHDCLQLMARVQAHPKDSNLWLLAKYNITVEDVNSKKIMDYRTLYSGHTEEMENKLRQAMLQDIHELGRLYGDKLGEKVSETSTMPKDRLGGKTVRQVLESATLENLDKTLEYAAKYPGDFFGQRWKTGIIYLTWMMYSTPPNTASSTPSK